jgi:hypothetical protein
MFVFQMAISARTVYQIAFNLLSDVGCAWTRESMAGVHVGFQAGVLASNGKPIDPANPRIIYHINGHWIQKLLQRHWAAALLIKPWGTRW